MKNKGEDRGYRLLCRVKLINGCNNLRNLKISIEANLPHAPGCAPHFEQDKSEQHTPQVRKMGYVIAGGVLDA